MNLSFAGCGFLGIYHVGVAVCFKKYAPHLLLDHISGASAGAIAACSLLCDLPIGKMVSDTLNLMREARMSTLGPFRPSFQIQDVLWKQLSQVLPEDAHLRVNGKLRISLTRVYDGKNVIVSHFDSKEDLLQALLASCFVPIFSGFVPPKFHGERYMDGGFSDNLPRFDENTITVSPFCGESDICPRDVAAQLFHINVANTSIAFSTQNIFRFARILYPPKPEVLSNMCKQGFEDALRFLQRNNLINCTKCLAVQSTFLISDTHDDSCDYDPQCQECQEHRKEATVAMLPDMLVTIFQEYIDSANKGLYNWLLSHRGMKLISLLSLPYVIPVEIALELCRKLNAVLQYMSASLKSMCAFLILQMVEVLETVSSRTGCNLTPNLQPDYENDEAHEKDINLSFTVYDKDFDVEHYTSSSLLDKPSYLSDPLGDDTFENILQVTSHHETIMAYYYRDEFNKVKYTEIFDVTEPTNEPTGDTAAADLTDWKDSRVSTWVEQIEDTLSKVPENCSDDNETVTSTEEDDLDEGANIFSDPESEWTMRNQSSLRPESDQKLDRQ